MKLSFTRLLLFCGLMTGAGLAQAQTLSHYPAGVEGIKGASLPPPGVYFRDYNYIYFADYLKNGPPKFDLVAYVQAPRLIWITGHKVLGGFYGMDAIVPFAYQNLDMTGFSGSDFSLGDIFIEPITLSWHGTQFDASFGYGIWTPSGDYSPTDPVAPGKGFLTHMLTGGFTVYPDKEKTWSFSALSRYEFSHESEKTKITPGQYFTLEWGLGKSVTKTIEVGFTGYVQAQTSKASGLGASTGKDHVAAFGPEITMACPKLGLATSIRYLREAGASGRPEGNTLNITFTRRLGP